MRRTLALATLAVSVPLASPTLAQPARRIVRLRDGVVDYLPQPTEVPPTKGTDVKEVLGPIIRDYAKNREDGERFGDFTIRAGYVKATEHGHDFHKDFVEPQLAL